MTAAVSVDQKAQLATVGQAGRVMLVKLSRTGSGNYTAEVKAFQQLWNEAADAVKAGGVEFRQLVTDGKYGANTAYAVQQFVKPAVPIRAYQIPTWYAQNKSVVDQMGSYQVPPPNTSTDFTPVNNQAVTEGAVDFAKNPTVVVERIEPASPPVDPRDQPMGGNCYSISPEYKDECKRLGWEEYSKRFTTEPEEPAKPVVVELHPAVIDEVMPAPAPMVGPTRLPEQVITAPKPSTDYRVVAVGTGVLLLGGLLTWNVMRKKKRRAA